MAAMPDIKVILKQKLELGSKELAVLQASLAHCEEEVSNALKEIPKGFRGSRVEYDSMDDKMKKLEYQHSTRTNMTNAQEREMLKEMEKNRKRKKELAAFLVVDDALKAAKQQRDEARKRFEAAESVQGELSTALRRLEMAERFGCKALDLVDRIVAVPEEARGRLVGRGGANIHAVEKDCEVDIDLERKGGKTVAKVCGLLEGVTKAVARLEEVTLSIVVDLELAQPYLVLLLARRSDLSNKLQKEHDVKIDVFLEGRRAQEGPGSRVAVTGRPEDVDKACAAIKALKAVSKHVTVPAKVRSAVIGKAGSNVIALEKEHNVVIDSSKEDSSEKMTVTGSAHGVTGAIAAINAIISAHEPVVLEIKLTTPFLSQVLLADKGARLRSLQSESGVVFTLEKDKGEHGVLSIAGPRGNATKGKEQAEKMLSSILKQAIDVSLGTATVGNVVGKGGSMIRDMRAPGIVVEVDEDRVRVFAEDAEAAQATATKVRDLVDRNQRLEVPLSSTLSRQLFGMPGRVIRKAILDLDEGSDLTMERDRASGAAQLKGRSEHLKSAAMLIKSFIASHTELTIELLCPEDERALVGGGEECALRLIQQMCHVDLTLGKQKGQSCVTVAGQEANVAEAERRIRGELDGSPDGTVVVVMVDEDAIGAAIGKKGANAKRIESQYNVKLDSIQPRSMIRIKGSDPLNVENARLDLMAVLAQVSTTMSLTIKLAYERWKYAIEGIAAECGLEAIECSPQDGGMLHIVIKGKEIAARTAKHRLTDLAQGISRKALELDAHQSKALKSRDCPIHKELRKISTSCTKNHGKLSIDITRIGDGALISVEGTPKGVAQAYHLLLVALSKQFPSMFLLVPLPSWPHYDRLHLPEYMQLAGKEALQAVADKATVDDVSPIIVLDAANKCVVVTAPSASCALKGKEELLKGWEVWFERHACVKAPEWTWGMIIGAKGANLKALKTAHGGDKGLTDINVDKEYGRIVLQGEPKFVASASVELEKKIANAKQVGKESGEHMVEMEVPNNLIPFVIGRKGVEIRRIEAATQTKLDTTSSNGGKADRVTIKGEPAACQAAEALVKEVLSKHDPRFAAELTTADPSNQAHQSADAGNTGCGWSVARQAKVLGVVKSTVEQAEQSESEESDQADEAELEEKIEPVNPEREEEEEGELHGKGWEEFLKDPVVEKPTKQSQPKAKLNQQVQASKDLKALEAHGDAKLSSQNQSRRKNKKEESIGSQSLAPPASNTRKPAAVPQPRAAQQVQPPRAPQPQRANGWDLPPAPISNESMAESALMDHFGEGSQRLMSLLFSGNDVAALAPPGLPVPVAALMTKPQGEEGPARYVPPAKRDSKQKQKRSEVRGK